MDQVKIGEFIARKRREQDLTQIQFAELVGVSNKTVSKWETGFRLPDVAIIQNVCDVLKISVNELLAGEEITEKEYVKKTEDNVIGLVKELDERKETKSSRCLGIVCSILIGISAVFLSNMHLVGSINIRLFFDLPTLLYIIGIFILVLGVTGGFTRYIAGYKCWLGVRKYSENEMNKIVCTMEYAKRLILLIGFFVSLVSVIALSIHMEHMETIGPYLASAVLSLLYTLLLEFVHDQILYKCRLLSLDQKRDKR